MADRLRAMNDALAEQPPPARALDAPVLFVAGAPRSGTTLLAQALIGYFELGFVDNLAARFWRAPLTGVTLSRSVFGADRDLPARSEYGRTAGADIHGFHFFWMEKLALEWVEDLFEDPAERGVDWRDVAGWVSGMQEASGGGFLFKGYYPAYFMPQVCALDPACVFVCIERDPIDQALSVHEARKTEMGNAEAWWSMQPPSYYDLVGALPERQILGQILGLNAHFRALAAQAPSRCVFVRYGELCENPEAELLRIGEDVARLIGMAPARRGTVPEIARTDRPRDAALVSRLEACLDELTERGNL